MGTQRVQFKVPLPWLVRWVRRAGTRDFFPALTALVSSTKYFLCVPIAQQPGQAVVQGRLPLNVRLWAPLGAG